MVQGTGRRQDMKVLKKIATIILLVAVAGNVAAMGGNEEMRGGMKKGMNMPTFADIDANGDGKISEQEFNEFHAARMSKMAADGRKMKHAGDMPGFSDVDTDGDGFISETELTTHQAEHHEQMQKHKKP